MWKLHYWVIFCLLFTIYLPSLWGFKMKAHVYIADKTREEILRKSSISFEGAPSYLRDIPVHNEEVLDAIRKYPEYYRAGAIGPDGFPDLIEGQIQQHVNKGEEKHVDSGVVMESRKFSELRSTDHFMIMLREAYKWPRGEERLQILAYLYGYATHMTTDAFAHEFMNEWTWGVFQLTKGDGLFGTITEELKHMAAESYIEHFIPSRNNLSELNIKIPYNYLYHLYTMPVTGLKVTGAEGSEGGVFYKNLIKMQKSLYAFAGKTNKEIGLDQETYSAIEALRHEIEDVGKANDHEKEQVIAELEQELQIDEAHQGGLLQDKAQGGSTVPNSVKSAGKVLIAVLKGLHVKQLFLVRAKLIDIFMHKWLLLNLCIEQNMLWGTNFPPDKKLTKDACAVIDFEDDPAIQNIFHGKLNHAIRSIGKSHGFIRREVFEKDEPNYGSVSNSLQRMMAFVGAFAERGLKFHPMQDLRVLQPINEIVAKCKRAAHGRKGHKSFTQSISPDDWKQYIDEDSYDDMEGVNLNDISDINEKGFRSAIHGTTTITTWATCKVVYKAYKQLKKIKKFINDQIDKILDKIKLKLLAYFYHTDYGRVLLAIKELSDIKNMNSPAMFINVAYLAEDLKHNPQYLNQIIEQVLDVKVDVVGPMGRAEQMFNTTFERTKVEGSRLLATVFRDLDHNQSLSAWKGLLQILTHLVDGKKIQANQVGWGQTIVLPDDTPHEIIAQTDKWIKEKSFGGEKALHLPFSAQMAKIVRVITYLELLMEVRGTAVHSIRENMNLPPELPGNNRFYDTESGTKQYINVELDRFYPIKNALVMAKLTLLSKKGIHELLKRKYPKLSEDDIPLGKSAICKQYPFIACDTLKSLDDPNGFGKPAPLSSIFPTGKVQDVNRSFSIWESSQTKWYPEIPPTDMSSIDKAFMITFQNNHYYARRIDNCQLSLTNFILANSWAVVKDYYIELFSLPPGCEEALEEFTNYKW